MNAPRPVNNVGTPTGCSLLRIKSPFGTYGSPNEWMNGDSTTVVYWYLATMSSAGSGRRPGRPASLLRRPSVFSRARRISRAASGLNCGRPWQITQDPHQTVGCRAIAESADVPHHDSMRSTRRSLLQTTLATGLLAALPHRSGATASKSIAMAELDRIHAEPTLKIDFLKSPVNVASIEL
jgi:hypothetical protein